MPKNTSIIPQNTNNLQTNKFIFNVPEMPIGSYFCQSVTFPGVATGEVSVPTPFSETFRHGDKLVYDPLVITFLVDEDLKSWEESYNWLRGLTFPHNFKEIGDQKKRRHIYSDGILTIHRNSQTPAIRVKFKHCHPTALGPITFAVTDDASAVPVADLTLRYDTFEIEHLS